MDQYSARIISFTIFIITLIFGVLSFRFQNKFIKYLFYQFLVNCFFTIVATWYLAYLKSMNKIPDNMWMMNIQLIIEMELIFFSLFWVLKSKKQRNIINGANLVFLAVYIYQGITDGIRVYLNWADLSACLGFTLLLYLVFYELSKVKQKAWWKSPEIIAVLGLFIYFACSVPFISMNNYLQENYPETAGLIYYNVAMALSHIRYLLFAIALFLVYKNSGKDLIRT